MSEIINPVRLQEFSKKTVCIIKFNNPLLIDQAPGRFFQATIDPGQLSPSGKYINFGNSPGDQLTGWQQVDWITIVEILGEWIEENEPPVLQYKIDTGVTILVPENLHG